MDTYKSLEQGYVDTADQLVERIRDFAKENPAVYELGDAWGLFKLGLKCDDLSPSLFQATWALAKVKATKEQSE